MRSLMEEYSNIIDRIDDMNLREAGLRQLIDGADEESELVDYFQANKSLIPIGTEGTRFRFIVKSYLDSFDPEQYIAMAKRDRSHMFEGYTVRNETFRGRMPRKKLMDAIFSEEPLMRVKMCAFYVIDTRGSVDSRSGYTYPPECSDRIPNPHLQYHDCLGNHARFIMERLKDGDTIGAIEQCVSSSKSVNLGEGITVTKFLSDLFNSNAKVIELNDGTSVTPVEALRWLEKQEEEKAKEA